jgi:hypothetical protein
MLGVALAVLAWWGLAGRSRLDRRTRAILEGATRVEVFRLDGKNDAEPAAEGEERIGGFLVTAHGSDQGKEFSGELADILADEKTYSADGRRASGRGSPSASGGARRQSMSSSASSATTSTAGRRPRGRG